MSVTERPFSIVCLSPQEWDVPLPTNRQQIMLRAAARDHAVLFVETSHFLGLHLLHLLRRPGRRSLATRLLSAEDVVPGIRATKALNVLPWGHKYAFACAVNNALTRRRILRRARRLDGRRVLWLYDPCSSGLVGSCGESIAVYDCVDDYVEQAGPSLRRRRLVAAADARAARCSRVVFATSRKQEERLRVINPRTHLVPNVGDAKHFQGAQDRTLASPEVADLPRPVIGFAGNMTSEKVDFDLLEALALARPDWTLLLVGPASDAAARRGLERLGRLPNVRLLGHRPYAELPRYVAAFDVGLIPYLTNPYTSSCFPLKLYEFLAAGKPVVATGLPDLAGMEPDVRLVDGVEAVVDALGDALSMLDDDACARRVRLAGAHTWETRAARLLELTGAELAG